MNPQDEEGETIGKDGKVVELLVDQSRDKGTDRFYLASLGIQVSALGYSDHTGKGVQWT